MKTAFFIGGAALGLTIAIIIKKQVKKTDEPNS